MEDAGIIVSAIGLWGLSQVCVFAAVVLLLCWLVMFGCVSGVCVELLPC